MAKDRSTFLRGDQILEKTIKVLAEAGEQINRAQSKDLDTRTRLFFDFVEREHKELERLFERYEEEGPPGVIERISQYSVEQPPNDFPEQASESITVTEMSSWLLKLYERLAGIYDSLAERAEASEAKEAFESLAGVLRSHGRKTSREASQAFDL